MISKRTIVRFGVLLGLAALVSGVLLQRGIAVKAKEREVYFLRFALLVERTKEEGGWPIGSIDELFAGLTTEDELANSIYWNQPKLPLYVYSDGVAEPYFLAERQEHRVGLFRSDRLELSRDGVVRWVSSGKIVE